MGGAVSTGIDHDDLIDKLKRAEYINTPSVEAVFRAVDRAFYFLADAKNTAYKDLAWKKGNLHLSAPCIYGKVMESLDLSPGMSFLNIGSGTGYLSTMAGLILGPYGINHGVELHEDVIEYANMKLSEFKQTSPALDGYEFCDPIFVKGNSLCLSTPTRLYDRVYCGAACPENHENYMKNLLKVGGILVVPLKDQLMQITRKTETEWESKQLLPVSFSDLQLPTCEEQNLNNVVLPDSQPLLLQEACRVAIRSLLRKRAMEEHGNLVVRKRRIYPKMCKKKLKKQNFIVPIFERRTPSSFGRMLESSDDEGLSPDFQEFPRLILSNRIGAVLNISGSFNRRRARLDEDASSDLDRSSTLEGDEEETEAGSSVNERVSKIPRTDSSDSVGSARGTPRRHNVIRLEDTTSADSDSDVSLTDVMEEIVGPGVNPDEDDGENPELNGMDVENGEGDKLPPEEEGVILFSVVMKEKIQALPLPPSLKSYLNYHREF